jgi:signal transduction histidine kinase
MPTGGRLDVTLHFDSDKAIIEVADTGMGPPRTTVSGSSIAS